MLTCSCGAVMVSDGKEWSCPISTQDFMFVEREPLPKSVNVNGQLQMVLVDQPRVVAHQYKHNTAVPDHRVTLNRGPVTVETVMKPMGGGHARRRSPRLHRGKATCCQSCYPGTYLQARRREEKLNQRR